MAIKAGQVIHDANGFVVDRIQTGGVSSLNIPEEKIYELGNQQTVTTIRDIADLTFDIESFDTSTEIEALLLGIDPDTVVDGDELDFNDALPLDVISPFKASGAYNVIKGIAIPYLTLESCTYRFGVGQNSTQSFSLRGDTLCYIPGTPMYQEITLVDGQLNYAFDQTALKYVEQGVDNYALSVCAKNVTTNTYKRLFIGTDFTNTTTGITLVDDLFDEGYTSLHVVYGTATAGTYAQSVHPEHSVKPGAVRGKDITVLVHDPRLATPALARWSGVQSFEVTRRVNLERDEELGNSKAVRQDYDTPEVSGSVVVRPADADDLWDKIYQIANISDDTQIVGPYSSIALPVEIQVDHPDTGARLKTFYIEDARFQIPATQGQVQQKLEVTFPFTSDGGLLTVTKGERP